MPDSAAPRARAAGTGGDIARLTEANTMIATAIIIGFFSAVGWWGGNKTTAAIDAVITPPAVQCTIEQK